MSLSPPLSRTSGLPEFLDGPLAVIGDLHGAAELLERLLASLRVFPDFEKRGIVFVGDFLDRGPDSRRCLDLVLDLLEGHPRVSACMGNHDLAACGAMGLIDTPPAAHWSLRYVADYDSWPTLASYAVGISEPSFATLADAVRTIRPYYDATDARYTAGVVPGDLEELRDETWERVTALMGELRERMPGRHREFLAGLPWCVEHPEYLIVHAGLTAEPYAQQLEVLRRRDFTRTRPPWLHERRLARSPLPGDCPVAVVSGHVVVGEVEFLQKGRRILVDTFGGHGTTLSAVLLPERMVVTSNPTT